MNDIKIGLGDNSSWSIFVPPQPEEPPSIPIEIPDKVECRASLKQIRESISFWEGKVAEAEREEQGRGRNRIYHFAPHDV